MNFSDINHWYFYIKKLKKNFRIIIWLQSFPSNLTSFRIYFFLKLQKIDIILTDHGSLPIQTKQSSIIQKIKKIPYRIKNLIYSRSLILSWYKKFFIIKIINIFYNYLNPNYILANGSLKYFAYKKKNLPNTKIISINVWDYSRYFNKKTYNFFLKKRYICYLSEGGPYAPGNSSLVGKARNWDASKYYIDLNRFLKILEKKFNARVIVSAHPRTSKNFEKKYLKSFKIFYGRSMELVRNAYITLSAGSSANNYSILFKKPSIFIYNNEYNKIPTTYTSMKLYSDKIGVKIVNISNNYQIKNIKLPKINLKKYILYEKKYLKSAVYQKTPNYRIIQKNILEKL